MYFNGISRTRSSFKTKCSLLIDVTLDYNFNINIYCMCRKCKNLHRKEAGCVVQRRHDYKRITKRSCYLTFFHHTVPKTPKGTIIKRSFRKTVSFDLCAKTIKMCDRYTK